MNYDPRSDVDRFLLENQFVRAGWLEENAGCLQFHCTREALAKPSVYLHIACEADNKHVLYAGMATDGWSARCRQHNGGLGRVARRLVNGERSRKNYEERVGILRRKGTIDVYERLAEVAERFGKVVPTQHAEERALICIFDPPHNHKSKRSRSCDSHVSWSA